MDEKELRELLVTYGDHRWGCAISRVLRGEEERLEGGNYPPCSCGWHETQMRLHITKK